MARTDPQINIRVPADLLEPIRSAAKKNGRSVTAEIVQRLQESFTLTESLQRERDEAHKDRVIDSLLLMKVGVGATVEPGPFRRRAENLIRTSQDADAMQSIAEKILETLEHMDDSPKSEPRDTSDKGEKSHRSRTDDSEN